MFRSRRMCSLQPCPAPRLHIIRKISLRALFLCERRGSKRTLSRSRRRVLVLYRIVIQRDAETLLFISIRSDSCRFGLVLHKIRAAISTRLFLGCLFNQHGHQNGIQFMFSVTSHSSVATQPNAVSLAIWSFQIP